MFEGLAAARERGLLGGSVASILVHAGVISGAVLATLQTGVVRPSAHPVVPLIYEVAPGPRPPAPPRAVIADLAPPPIGVAVLTVPTSVPTVIPPPGAMRLDPRRFEDLPPADVPAFRRMDPAAEDIHAERAVEDPPELLSHPAPHYPELLRQAGIEGRVVVEAVIDTTGHVEPRSVRVVSSTNPQFDAPARELVAGALYRAGRVEGRAVRVRVTVPVTFEVARRPPIMNATP